MVRAARPRFIGGRLPPLGYLGRIQSIPPFWLEGRGAMELVRLRRHPVFTGEGIPRGDGQPVLLIPGFMAGDSSLTTIHQWLLRVGYHAEVPGLVFNVRYSEEVLRSLVMRLVAMYTWLGQKVTVIGHSRGGLLAKVIGHRHPHMVERVISLGSPLADPFDIHPITMAGVRLAQAFNLLRFRHTADVERRFLRDLNAAARVPLTSIYSRTDGIVYWQACLRNDANCYEVESSHVGLVFNADVYELIARLLAESMGKPTSSS